MQLQRKGVIIPEDGGTISDPELLMEVMEQREAVEETDDPTLLQEMLAANRKSEQTTVQVQSLQCIVPHVYCMFVRDFACCACMQLISRVLTRVN